MEWNALQTWLSQTSMGVVAAMLFAAMAAAAAVGVVLRRRVGSSETRDDGQEGYIVSAVLGLLALLMGFTFSLAVDRFETRRHLVLEEAQAIEQTYYRAQLLSEPHRSRMSDLIIRYVDNRIRLAKARPGEGGELLAANDAMITDMWAATSAAFETIKGVDFSSTYVDGVNQVINLDAARKAARQARVPPEVFAVLIVYMITAAGVLGYVLRGLGGRATGAFLLALLTLSLVLVIDVDRPTLGGITEKQTPMEDMLRSLKATPRSAYDRWREPPPAAALGDAAARPKN
jgi:hypothetical protein